MRVVHMLDEGQAVGQIKEIYRDMERTLGAPMVGSAFRALAARPEVLQPAWEQIKRNAQTQSFIDLTSQLRNRSDQISEAVFELDDLYSWLREHGFGREDLRRIRYSLEMLHSFNPKMLLATAAMHVSLHGTRNPRIIRASPVGARNQEPEFPTKAPRVKSDQAPTETLEIFLDAIDAVGAPVVPDDLQILAAWPALLRRVWRDLKPVMHSVTFIDEAARLSAAAIEAAQELPYPVDLDNAGIDVRRMIDMFITVQSRMQMATAAVRWMVVEGERLGRVMGRAAGEGTF